MSWKPVAGVTVLRDQVNKRFPKRDKASDGIKGDSDHATRLSDHNPDSRGFVHALDIDEGFGRKGDSKKFADQLAEYCRQNRKGSERIKYIVYEDQVASGTYPETFWVFRGSGFGHYQHIHTSFTTTGENDKTPFDIPILQKDSMWDGFIPSRDSLAKSYVNPALKNKASYRLACRLKDLGYYKGDIAPMYEQGYPTNAILNFKKAKGLAPHERITKATQQAIFDGLNA